MSQKSPEVQRLEALLLKKEQETRAIEDQLNRARSTSKAAPFDLDPALRDYQVAALRPSINDHGRSRSNTVPRSAAGVGGVLVDVGLKTEPALSQMLDQTRPMKRSKTTHHPAPIPTSSAGKMMRSASNTSHGTTMVTANTHAFVPKGSAVAVTPQYHSVTRNSFSGPVMMENYLAQDQQQPVNAFLHGNPQALYPGHNLGLGLSTEPLVNDGRELGIAEFLSMRGDDEGISTTSPVQIPTGSLLSPQSAYFSASSGIPSACGSMTSGPTIETPPMTRSNSTMNDNASISGNFTEMLRIESQQSGQGYMHQDSFSHSQAISQPRKRSAMLEPDCLAMGSNLNDFSNLYGSSAPLNSDLFQHQHAMERSASQESNISSSASNDVDAGPDSANLPAAQHMERSISNTSIRSNQSLKIRAQDALRRQNVHAKSRSLFPKPASGEIKKEHVEPSLSKPKDGKAVISKAKYERPKHPKVKCEQCNENPEGFRGEHELRRHTEAKHKSTVKKWICRDPDEAGVAHTEAALKSLRDCKQCQQKKQYGAYYNAAAHLRRTHFKVKPARKAVSKGSNSASQLENERRGGKGGGDWPSMAELKLWMVEINVHMDQEGALAPDNVDSVDAPDQEDLDNERAEAMAYGSQANLGVNVGQDAYDMTTAFAGVGGVFGHDLDDHSYQTLQGDLGSQNPELYLDTLYAQSSLHRIPPLSSSNFDFSQSPSQQTQHHMASSMMSIDSHSYTSPVSSTATITQTGGFGDHQMLASSNMLLSRDDLADMSFDLAFATVRQ